MLNDDILIAQSSLWANLKLEGKSIKYNQMVSPNVSSHTSSVPSANQFASYITILSPSLVGHKVYAKITTSNPKIRLGWYITNNSGYDFVDGSALSTSSSVSNVFEGVYEITQDMVHTGTGYLQLYYWLYNGLPTGSHEITIQLVDLTELGMDNIINPVLFNATDLGKVMAHKTLSNGKGILSFKAPYKCYKDTPMESMFGKQNVESEEVVDTNYNFAPTTDGSFSYYNVPNNKRVNIKANHKYFFLGRFKENFTFTNFALWGLWQDSSTPIVRNTPIIVGKDYFTILGSSEYGDEITQDYNNTIPVYQIGTTATNNYVIKLGLLIDLTELGLDSLTAQQFYDRYNQYFDKLANGETNSIAEINMWKRVDLGTLNWYKADTGMFTSNGIINDTKKPAGSDLPNAICDKYKPNAYWSSAIDKTFAIATNGDLYLFDNDYDSEVDLKNSLNGVYLYYETATPVELYGINLLANTYENINGRSNVVLGNITFSGNESWNDLGGGFYSLEINDIKSVESDSIDFILETYNSKSMYSTGNAWQNAKKIYVVSSITTLSDFKNSLIGKKLIYELATPRTDYYLSRMIPKNVVKIIDDNGMEVDL